MTWACNHAEKRETVKSTAEINAMHPVEVSIDTVDYAAVQELIQNKKVVILDVRTPEEYREGHIPHALNIDFQSPSFETEILNLNREHHYLVYCRSGKRALNASKTLQSNGFASIKIYPGSWNDWVQHSDVVEK
ncbi:MAG: rhodanese-like domain-containing protein [Chitinophagales bacterium]|nr:rhodanese-like domain-containing protein [Chitinophagales bacterium]